MKLFTPAKGRRLIFGLRRVIGKRRTDKLMTRLTSLRYRCRRCLRVRVEVLDFVKPGSLFISGTVDDPKHRITRWELLFDGGRALVVNEQMIRFDGKTGMINRRNRDQRFIALLDTGDITLDTLPVGFRLTDDNGKTSKRPIEQQNPTLIPIDRIRNILKTVPAQATTKRELFDTVVGPTLSSIWCTREVPTPPTPQRFNPALYTDHPEVTLIIPIYGRYDFIEHQLTHFCNDESFSRFQILYVVDDPRITEEALSSCSEIARIYPISFDVLFLPQNLGYATANNQGARYADASRLLLLNSDVIPTGNGWLSTMLATHAALPGVSILGARLLYEDGTIQHDGMRFDRSPFMNDLWTNVHPGKGLPSDLFTTDSPAQPRETVTGACLLVNKTDYLQLDGFDESYILGDYEDSDFCLRARQAGLKIFIDTSVSLYHLERQSQSMISADRWKQELTYYNCWMHTNRWDSAVTALKLENGHACDG